MALILYVWWAGMCSDNSPVYIWKIKHIWHSLSIWSSWVKSTFIGWWERGILHQDDLWFLCFVLFFGLWGFWGQHLDQISPLPEQLCGFNTLIAWLQHSPLPTRCYPTENWMRSRCLTSVIVRELVFPSWHQPLTRVRWLDIFTNIFFFFFQAQLEQKSSENAELTSKLTHTLKQLESTKKEAKKLMRLKNNNSLELRDQQYSDKDSKGKDRTR